MKMIQTLYPTDKPWSEIFYDGELKVVNNIVEIPEGKEHWQTILFVERGFREYEEPPSEAPSTPSPSRKKVKDTPNDQ